MPLTRDFRETVREIARSDPEYRVLLFAGTLDEFLTGDLQAAKALLRDYIHATVGFEALARALSKSPKSLMRMLSSTGNPQASNLFAIFHYLQAKERIELEVTARATGRRAKGNKGAARRSGRTRPASTGR